MKHFWFQSSGKINIDPFMRNNLSFQTYFYIFINIKNTPKWFFFLGFSLKFVIADALILVKFFGLRETSNFYKKKTFYILVNNIKIRILILPFIFYAIDQIHKIFLKKWQHQKHKAI